MRKIIAMLCAAIILQSTAYASNLSQWAMSDFEAASRAGLLSYDVAKNNFSEDITRGEFCVFLMSLYKNISDKEIYTPEESPFEDCDNESVAQAYGLGIASGKEEGIFDPEGMVTREEMAKLIINTLKAAEINLVILKSEAEELVSKFEDFTQVSQWAFAEVAVAVKYSVMSGVSENLIEPKSGAKREQALAMINRVYNRFAQEKTAYEVPEFLNLAENMQISEGYKAEMSKIEGAKKYLLIVKDQEGNPVVSKESTISSIIIDTTKLKPDTKYTIYSGVRINKELEVFALPIDVVYKPEQKAITVVKTDNETLNAKNMRVFPEGIAFQTEEEAKANMVSVEVDVWTINKNGEKVASKRTIEVNQFLKDDVIAIFREIFDDPAKFPMKGVSGYCWRMSAMGKLSQHSYGTCIDINPDENYYCYSADGTAITGTHWLPYEDEYSITPDGPVVAAFAKYGWIWGGNWTGSVKDYMHFTYLGK